MQAVHPRIGGILGRADIASGMGGAGSLADADPYQPFVGTLPSASGNASASGSVDLGKLSAGMLGAGVLFLVMFYVYTRRFQR